MDIESVSPSGFHRDPRVESIAYTFGVGRELGLIHHYADDVPLSGRLIPIDGRDYVNFVTCSYLGLEFDPRIIDGIVHAARKYGSSFIVSRTYCSSPPFREFEQQLAQLFGAYPVVVPSTTLGHLSFMTVMIQPGDVILLDQQVHNSVQLSAQTVHGKAKILPVRHNDVGRLAKLVERYLALPETNHVWYCGDGIYSMYGDVAPVRELVAILEKHDRFFCYMDDAHGMSTRGKHGRGYVLGEQETLHPRMVVAVSLSKCFGVGCGGALVMPNAEWQDAIRTCGATMIFSSPMPPPMLGGAIASARIHLSPEIEQLKAELADRIQLFHREAARMRVETVSSELSPVQYVMIGDIHRAWKVARAVLDDGFLVNICAYPAVAMNHSGLRMTISRHLTDDDIRGVLASVRRAIDATEPDSLERTKPAASGNA